MHTPQTIMPLEGPWKLMMQDAHLMTYGMGWYPPRLSRPEDRAARRQHRRDDALVAMMPEEQTGLVILTNLGGNFLTYALMYRVFDAFLKNPPKDWSAQLHKGFEELVAQGKAEEKKREAARIKGTSPSLALEKYAGTYADSMYGEASVKQDGGKLVLRYGTMVGDLEHWQHDTFRSIWRERSQGKGFVTFDLDADSKVDEMKIEDVAEFKRKPEVVDTTPAVQLAESDLPSTPAPLPPRAFPSPPRYRSWEGELKLTVPGQPPYTLVPVSATRFRLSGGDTPAGFFLDYTMDGIA